MRISSPGSRSRQATASAGLLSVSDGHPGRRPQYAPAFSTRTPRGTKSDRPESLRLLRASSAGPRSGSLTRIKLALSLWPPSLCAHAEAAERISRSRAAKSPAVQLAIRRRPASTSRSARKRSSKAFARTGKPSGELASTSSAAVAAWLLTPRIRSDHRPAILPCLKNRDVRFGPKKSRHDQATDPSTDPPQSIRNVSNVVSCPQPEIRPKGACTARCVARTRALVRSAKDDNRYIAAAGAQGQARVQSLHDSCGTKNWRVKKNIAPATKLLLTCLTGRRDPLRILWRRYKRKIAMAFRWHKMSVIRKGISSRPSVESAMSIVERRAAFGRGAHGPAIVRSLRPLKLRVAGVCRS